MSIAQRSEQGRASTLGRVVCVIISLATAGVFFAGATLGGYDTIARYAGSGWVFLLTMIVTLPTVMPWLKKRAVSREA